MPRVQPPPIVRSDLVPPLPDSDPGGPMSRPYDAIVGFETPADFRGDFYMRATPQFPFKGELLLVDHRCGDYSIIDLRVGMHTQALMEQGRAVPVHPWLCRMPDRIPVASLQGLGSHLPLALNVDMALQHHIDPPKLAMDVCVPGQDIVLGVVRRDYVYDDRPLRQVEHGIAAWLRELYERPGVDGADRAAIAAIADGILQREHLGHIPLSTEPRNRSPFRAVLLGYRYG